MNDINNIADHMKEMGGKLTNKIFVEKYAVIGLKGVMNQIKYELKSLASRRRLRFK